MKHQGTTTVADLIQGYYFNYIPSLTIIFKSLNAGIFLSYLVYWQGHGVRSDGWIFKTIDEALLETGLTRFQQDNAIHILTSEGILQVKRTGSRGRRHFLLVTEVLESKIVSLSETSKLKLRDNTKNYKHKCKKPTNTEFDRNKQTLTKDTDDISYIYHKRPSTTAEILSGRVHLRYDANGIIEV